jgi:hypothetical protein
VKSNEKRLTSMTDYDRVRVKLLEDVLTRLRAKASAQTGRPQDQGLRAAIELIEDMLQDIREDK